MSSLRHMNTGLVLAGLLIALKRIHRTDQSGPVCGSAGGMRLSRSESLWINTLPLGLKLDKLSPEHTPTQAKEEGETFLCSVMLCVTVWHDWCLVLELVYPEHSRGRWLRETFITTTVIVEKITAAKIIRLIVLWRKAAVGQERNQTLFSPITVWCLSTHCCFLMFENQTMTFSLRAEEIHTLVVTRQRHRDIAERSLKTLMTACQGQLDIILKILK